ncbi:MAG: hypothetical protein V2A76_07595 [Planctomycetota bacterium]
MFRGLTSLALLILLGTGGFLAYQKFTEEQAQFAKLAAQNEEKKQIIDRLTRSSRVAQARLLERWTEDDGRVMSRILFVEVDNEGLELSRKKLTVEGKVVYFDALVLKFDPELVGKADELRGKSILLFRRIFGEHQKPSEGVELGEGGEKGIPDFFLSKDSPTPQQVALWKDFWKLANDCKAAAAAGVRGAHGEAPYTEVEENMIYTLRLDHAGGLNIVPSKVQPVMLGDS